MSTTADERSSLLLKRKKLNESLRRLRMDQAIKLKVPAMQVFQNSTLADIVVLLPKSKVELMRIKGLGPTKVVQFGDAILSAVEAYCKECSRNNESPLTVSDSASAPVITPDDKESNVAMLSVCHADEDDIGVGPLLGAEFV